MQMRIVVILKALATFGAVLLFAATGSLGAPQEGSRVIVYSDICVHPESGDLLGSRVVVMRFVEGSYVLFQMAEGVLEAPQSVAATIDKNGDILFRLPESEKVLATFKGKMTDQSLTGTFDNHWTNGFGKKTFQLPKVAGPQRSFPPCK